jgi:acyl-CoA thioesterase-1
MWGKIPVKMTAGWQRGSVAGATVAAILALACGSSKSVPKAPADSARVTATAPVDSTPVVLFVGTSLTAGLGLPADEAYPALIQQKIDSAGLPFRAVNAGVSGETSAGALRRIDWLLRQPVRVLVLEEGANDGLRGLDPDSMAANLQEIIDRTRAAHPGVRIVIAGMMAPPNMGTRYTTRFEQVFPEIARRNHAALIPFLLAGVAAVPRLNQSDGMHPTAEGDRIVADNVWKVLRPVLDEVARKR